MIFALCLMVISYGVGHRLFEFAWKGQLRLQYPSALAYQVWTLPWTHVRQQIVITSQHDPPRQYVPAKTKSQQSSPGLRRKHLWLCPSGCVHSCRLCDNGTEQRASAW